MGLIVFQFEFAQRTDRHVQSDMPRLIRRDIKIIANRHTLYLAIKMIYLDIYNNDGGRKRYFCLLTYMLNLWHCYNKEPANCLE